MSDFCTLWPGGPKFRQSGHFPLGTDSVLLADFVNLSSLRRGIDLGCGSGIIALLLLCRDERLNMTGIVILPEAVETARENMSENGLEDRGDIVAADIRVCREQFKTGAFDFATFVPDAKFLFPEKAPACLAFFDPGFSFFHPVVSFIFSAHFCARFLRMSSLCQVRADTNLAIEKFYFSIFFLPSLVYDSVIFRNDHCQNKIQNQSEKACT